MRSAVKVKSKVSPKHNHEVSFPAHGHVCLNCGHEVVDNFCSICGQSIDTHRLSIMHFVLHDLVHSLWHIDRGIFFTLKEVLIRPGYAALDFNRGKRAGRFPILTLLLLLIGAMLWLTGFSHQAEPNNIIATGTAAEMVKWLTEFVHHNVKWILLGMLPISSLSTLIVFNRTRLNYTEHLVVNSYIFGGLLTALLGVKLFSLAFPAIIPHISGWTEMFGLVFYLVGYWQAYHAAYRKLGIVWRFIALFFLGVLLFIIVVVITFLIASFVFHVPGSQNIFNNAAK